MRNKNGGQFRPVSAVNKLSKIKKNIIPNLIPSTPSTLGNIANKREKSVSPRSFNNRIKSAHPLNFDRERLMEENISLKTQLNKVQREIFSSKKEINNLENEIIQKDKIIEEIMNDSQLEGQGTKIAETHLVINLKKQYKELKKENEKILKDLEVAKKNIKSTKLNELVNENRILTEQIDKLKDLYQHSQEQTMNIEQNVQDLNIMKEALSKQDYIILNFQENYQKMTEEIKNLHDEIAKLEKTKQDKNETINKLKQKLKFQHQINEKLVIARDNIQTNKIYIEMKNKYDTKLQKMRKDLAYYKDSNSKNEKLIREMKQFQSSPNSNYNTLSSQPSNPPRMIYSSNPQPIIESQSQTNAKVLLLQSKYLEERTEKEKLMKENSDLKSQLSNMKKTETKVVLTGSFSTGDINKPIKVTEYDFFSDYVMNEFTYILVKNFEANKIDMSIIESRVLSEDILKTLTDNTSAAYKAFVDGVSNSICDILKATQEKDQVDIHSFIKTFLFNFYISKKSNNPDDFKSKFLSLFDSINFYSIEQKQELNRVLAAKLSPLKSELLDLIKFFDENNTGYITFTSLKKIIQELKIKLKNEILEYFIYTMKNFHDESRYLKDLKYSNLIKIIDETQCEPNDANDEEEKEKDDDDEAIEITNEEYLQKVHEIIVKICKVLKQKNKCVDDFFAQAVSKSINDYKGIQLITLVDILKKDFGIELSHLEIFCLFTKIKPGNSMSKEYDENIEEIIDYDKLKKEIENCLREEIKEGKDDKVEASREVKKKTARSETAFQHAKKENDDDELKELIIGFMKKYGMTYERFVFPIHCMMKLTTNGKKFNRYIDIELFKHFLYQNSILINNDSLMKFLSREKLLFNNERVNLDYLKFIVSGQKGIRDNKINDFMEYKPLKQKDDSDMKNLQKEIYGDDDEIEEIKNKI